jgi:hypothetical protein
MSDDLDPLVLDFLEWVARQPRAYVEVIDTWRTSCPRLTIWEDAIDRGFVERGTVVTCTARGKHVLAAAGRMPEPAAGVIMPKVA